MKPIPAKLRKQINEDDFFKRCCLTGSANVSIEHCWQYGHGQINELWAIVPLRRDLNTSHPPREVKEKCQLISLRQAEEAGIDLNEKYPRKDWDLIRFSLEKIYKGNLSYMPDEKKEPKKSKFKKCKKCGQMTTLMICTCGNSVFKQK
jgi:hypothetical protein